MNKRCARRELARGRMHRSTAFARLAQGLGHIRHQSVMARLVDDKYSKFEPNNRIGVAGAEYYADGIAFLRRSMYSSSQL